MYAIVDIAGQQFKVEKDQKLFVHRLDGEEGKKVSFDQVLLIDNDGKISIGDPVVKGAAVSAKILEHVKSDKVLVFKKKRRKGYQKLNGHRQYMTQIQIESISEKAASKAQPAEKTAAEPKAQATEKKPAAKPAAKAAVEKKETAATKPAAAKKPAASAGKGGETKAASAKATAAKKPAAKKPAAGKSAPKKDSEKK